MAKAKKQEPAAAGEPTAPPTEPATPKKRAAKAKESPATQAAAAAPDAAPQAKAEAPAKKPAKGGKAEAPKTQAAKAAGPSKPDKKDGATPAGTATPATPAVPLIDTGLAAQAAAAMVAHRDLLGGGTANPTSSQPAQPQPQAAAPAEGTKAPATPKQESSAFKQLKQGMNKAGGSLNTLLGPPGGHKKPVNPFGAAGQSFRNQTTGGFNKTGVPRRTSGG